jgi:hypothetical protein
LRYAFSLRPCPTRLSPASQPDSDTSNSPRSPLLSFLPNVFFFTKTNNKIYYQKKKKKNNNNNKKQPPMQNHFHIQTSKCFTAFQEKGKGKKKKKNAFKIRRTIAQNLSPQRFLPSQSVQLITAGEEKKHEASHFCCV